MCRKYFARCFVNIVKNSPEKEGGKSKKFKIIKTITSNKKTTYIDRKVKRNKKYYYKIRGFRTVDKKKIYGKYSAVKSIKR